MADDMKNTDPTAPQPPEETPQVPVAPEPSAQPAPAPAPQSQPQTEQMPPQQQPPAYGAQQPMYTPQPQPVYPPAPLMQLTGGMKFAWLVVGALLGIPGIIISWLVNVDKMPQVKSDALKFAVIGFVIWIVLQVIFGMVIFGTISAAIYGMMGSMDYGSYGSYGHGSMW